MKRLIVLLTILFLSLSTFCFAESGVYTKFKELIGKGDLELDTANFSIILLDSVHAFNAAHDTISDVSANELATANGYTAEGQALDNRAFTVDGVNWKLDFDDETWAATTITGYHAVVYVETGVAYADETICFSVDFTRAITTSASTFTVSFHADGAHQIQ